MNPKTFLSKTTSLVASIVLAIGGSLVATQPATAADFNSASFVNPPQGGMNSVSLTISSCSMSMANPTTVASDFTVTVNTSPVTVTISYGSYLVVNLPSSLQGGDALSISYTKGSTTIPCTSGGGNVVGSFGPLTAVALSGGGGGGGGGGSNIVTLNANGGVLGSTTSIIQNGGGAPVTLPASGSTAPTKTNCTLAGWATSQIRANAALLITGTYVPMASETVYASWTCTGGSTPQSTAQVTREVTRSIPVPAFQAPILNSLAPKMTGGFSSNGGRLVLKDVKPADITSVMLNGKKVEVISSKSGAALRIPAGAGAGDLKFTMADGTVIEVANAVKITSSLVDPKLVDLNPLPTFKAGSVAVPAAIKSALNKRKAIILDSVSAKCVGYASSNTAAARATALSRASNVCGVITDINENIEPIVKVLVNKTVAKKSPVKYQTW